MSLQTLRNRFAPFATRQNFLKLANPALRLGSSRAAVENRLAPLLEQHDIKFLDLGGWAPAEGYLTLHLSSVEPFGFPSVCFQATENDFDEATGTFQTHVRELERPGVSLHFDIFAGLPLKDGWLNGVNLSHFFEHFDLDAGRIILRECRRVLSANGVIRISCPDLRKYAAAYLGNDVAFFNRVGRSPFCNYPPLPTNGAVFAAKAYDGANGHRWFYDAETTCALLRESGFKNPEGRGLHQSALPNIARIEPAFREVESYYVEAVR